MSSEEPKFEIIDFTGENMSLFSFKCSTVMSICIALALLGFLLYSVFYTSLVTISISIGLVIVFFIYSSSSGKGMLRKFTIYESRLEILLPRRDPFSLEWSQIDEIKVKLKILNVNPFQFYEITFFGEKKQSKINFNLKDFNRENLLQILKTLKIETISRHKKFSATKEEIVSGIFLVDDLDI
ncbi:MAG: hypothetical protein ACTSP9_11350 [Promethearchaeota archaeon]